MRSWNVAGLMDGCSAATSGRTDSSATVAAASDSIGAPEP